MIASCLCSGISFIVKIFSVCKGCFREFKDVYPDKMSF